MGLTTFVKGTLSSRSIRSVLTKGSGIREMNLAPITKNTGGGLSKFLQSLGGGLVKVFNFLGGALQWLHTGQKTIGDWVRAFFVDGVRAFTTFDWNQADSDIKQDIKQDALLIIEQAGELTGYALSSTVVLGVTYLIPVIGPILTIMSIPELTRELIQKTLDLLKEFIFASVKIAIKSTYLAIRGGIRSLVKNYGTDLKKLGPAGDSMYNSISNWGSENGKPWSIAGAVNENIEKLPEGAFLSDALKAFIEGGAEGISEGYEEAVAVVSLKLDEYLQTQQTFGKNLLGQDKTLKIEIKEDSENPTPPIVLSGPQRVLEATASSAIATIQTLAMRDIGTVYSQPSDAHQQKVTFLPHVKLIFWENLEDVEKGYSALEAELSFRLHGETSETWTPQKSARLAEKIKTIFAKPRYRFQKGQTKCTYRDRAKGYQLTAFVSNEAGARDLFEKVLEIQGDTFDPTKFGQNKLGKTLPTVPEKQIIYGETRRLPRERPTGWVVFNNAQLHLWGLTNVIILVDCSRRKRGAILRA